MAKLKAIGEDCWFCRRRVWRPYRDPRFEWKDCRVYLTCKRHRNKPINITYYRLPVVITDHMVDANEPPFVQV